MPDADDTERILAAIQAAREETIRMLDAIVVLIRELPDDPPGCPR